MKTGLALIEPVIRVKKVRDTVEVKSFTQSDELYVVAKSDGRRLKEMAMRRRKLTLLLRALRAMRWENSRDRILMRIGAAKAKAKGTKGYVCISVPPIGVSGRSKPASGGRFKTSHG